MQLVRLASELVLCHDKPKSCPRSLVHPEGKRNRDTDAKASQLRQSLYLSDGRGAGRKAMRKVGGHVPPFGGKSTGRGRMTCATRMLTHFSRVETSFSILLQQGGRLPICGALALPSNCAWRSAGFTSLVKHLFARTCDKSSALSVNLPSLARQPSWTGASSS